MSAAPVTTAVIWHEVECGGFEADLGLWEELATDGRGPLLDLGCGTGRVALHLARRGHDVHGLDVDLELVEALRRRSQEAGLSVETTAADARDFKLDREFATVLAPMQLIQLFEGPEQRVACMRCAREHLRPGGTMAVAIVDGFPDELVEDVPPPLPDTREVEGWVFSSLPLDATLDAGAIVIRRLRQIVSPSGELDDEVDEIPLLLLDAATVEAEGREAGFEVGRRLEIPATDLHVGSTVLLLENRA
ncbi:MAG TPA: class I SAM-dependent methyltransferase [Solirubrobacterales bacterium]